MKRGKGGDMRGTCGLTRGGCGSVMQGGKEKGAVGKEAKKGKAGGTGAVTEAAENVEPEDMSPEALEEKAAVLVDPATLANLKSSVWKERLEGGEGGMGGWGGVGRDDVGTIGAAISVYFLWSYFVPPFLQP